MFVHHFGIEDGRGKRVAFRGAYRFLARLERQRLFRGDWRQLFMGESAVHFVPFALLGAVLAYAPLAVLLLWLWDILPPLWPYLVTGVAAGAFAVRNVIRAWPPRFGRRFVGKVLAEGRCASCAYELAGLKAADDGCVVCPECGAAWRLPPP